MVTMRRKTRIIALQTLYEVDCTAHEPAQIISRLAAEASLPDEAEQFARELVAGVLQNKQMINNTIRELAPAWPLEQIPIIDRNVLRLAIFELLLDNKVPVKAAINEAVELAKTFGSDNSPKFVNGVLASVITRVNR